MNLNKTLSKPSTWALFSIIGIASVAMVAYTISQLLQAVAVAHPHMQLTTPKYILLASSPFLTYGVANGAVAFLDTVFGLRPASLFATGKA
jgi:hypothetical protein